MCEIIRKIVRGGFLLSVYTMVAMLSLFDELCYCHHALSSSACALACMAADTLAPLHKTKKGFRQLAECPFYKTRSVFTPGR